LARAGTNLMLAVLALALAACSKPVPAPEPVRAVRTLTVGTSAVGASQEFAAEVRARTETRLAFRVPGRLVQRPAEVGQRVRAGQLLAQLDATDLKLGLESARSAVQAAQAQVDLGTAELKRYQDLRQQGFISALELERRETALHAQRAQLSQAQAQLSVQGNQAGYASLVATAAGVVTAVDAEVGAVLAAGSPLLRLAHDGARDAVFSVPEDAVAGLRQLMAVPGALRVKAWSQPDTMVATVREVAAAADPSTRTFLVKATMPATGAGADLQLGQTLTVRIEQPVRSGVIRLPLSAVVQQQGRASVWLLDPATLTVRPQPVVVAGADGNQLVVTQGLSAGQVVVTAGVHTLTAGQKVQLYGAAAKADTPAAAPATAASVTPR
jgi:RND family efflux transporter MFP subunit